MKKTLGFIISLFAFFLLFTIPVSASEPRVIDEADLLTDSEEKKLESQISDISGKYNFDLVIVTVESLEGEDVVTLADDIFDYGGFGYGDNRDGMLFLLSMGERKWAISTCGYGLTAFTDYATDLIGDEVKGYLTDEKYYDGFSKFVSMSDDFLDQAKNGKPYDINNTYFSSSDRVITFLITMAVIAVISLVVALILKAQLKTARPQQLANEYIKKGSFNLRINRDSFLYSHVTKRERPKENSSGGGTSSHTSSSGSSHGGSSGSF